MVDALGSTTKATVLVVDDTADNLEVISGLLKDLYQVKVASNGEAALKIAQSGNPPDLILLDIMMPELSGYEVCMRLKSDPATRDIPVLFLSALASAEDEAKGLELGAEDYITKPASPAILLARVKTHLRLKALADFLKEKNASLKRDLGEQVELTKAVLEELKAATDRFSGTGGR
jgi:putative two-component system response regulator